MVKKPGVDQGIPDAILSDPVCPLDLVSAEGLKVGGCLMRQCCLDSHQLEWLWQSWKEKTPCSHVHHGRRSSRGSEDRVHACSILAQLASIHVGYSKYHASSCCRPSSWQLQNSMLTGHVPFMTPTLDQSGWTPACSEHNVLTVSAIEPHACALAGYLELAAGRSLREKLVNYPCHPLPQAFQC